jgi:Bacterial antitoxin of type II TA system, VapB
VDGRTFSGQGLVAGEGTYETSEWHIHVIRTTLDIDERLMEALMARHPGKSRTEAVEVAIADHVRRGAVDRFLALQGSLDIEDVSAEMRAIDRRIWKGSVDAAALVRADRSRDE